MTNLLKPATSSSLLALCVKVKEQLKSVYSAIRNDPWFEYIQTSAGTYFPLISDSKFILRGLFPYLPLKIFQQVSFRIPPIHTLKQDADGQN